MIFGWRVIRHISIFRCLKQFFYFFKCCIFEAATAATVLLCCISWPKNAINSTTNGAYGTIFTFGKAIHNLRVGTIFFDIVPLVQASGFYVKILLRLHFPDNALVPGSAATYTATP